MEKVENNNTADQISFYKAANRILEKHISKHPAIPLIIGVLNDEIFNLNNPWVNTETVDVVTIPSSNTPVFVPTTTNIP